MLILLILTLKPNDILEHNFKFQDICQDRIIQGGEKGLIMGSLAWIHKQASRAFKLQAKWCLNNVCIPMVRAYGFGFSAGLEV